jgi:hypothetical protein
MKLELAALAAAILIAAGLMAFMTPTITVATTEITGLP